MVVLQFARRPRSRRTRTCRENHVEQSVVYTGTHDNDTALGWWESLSDADRGVDRARPATTRRGR